MDYTAFNTRVCLKSDKKVCFPNDRKKVTEVEISFFQNEQTCANARHFRVPAESVANETGKTMGQ